MIERAVKEVLSRPFSATKMLWAHRRTLAYLWRTFRWPQLYNFVFVTYFIRGEDCGKGVLDVIWKFLPGLTLFLWDIEVEVTTRCYLRCVMCEHTFFPPEYLNQDLTFEQFKALVDSVPKLKWINLTGEGSSFLNKDFMDMVRYAKGKGLYVDFSHDFLYMPTYIARELIELGVERIYVSIDAVTKETYEKIRVGSNFDKVVNNIKRFVELKRELKSPLPELCFRMTFFKDNIHEVENLIGLIHSFGTREDLGDEPSVNIVGLLEFEETKGWVREIDPWVVERTNLYAKLYGFKMYWSHPSHDENKKPPLDYCTFWSEPYIMIGGYVLPCCAILMSNRRPFLERYAFGNINRQSLREIWNSLRFKAFRRLVTNPHDQVPILCAGCRTFNTSDRARKYGISREI